MSTVTSPLCIKPGEVTIAKDCIFPFLIFILADHVSHINAFYCGVPADTLCSAVVIILMCKNDLLKVDGH